MTSLSEEVRGRHGVPAEEELGGYAATTTALLDAIDDIFYVCTPAGKLRRWNESLREWSGYDDDELATMTIQECLSGDEDDVGTVESALRTATERGTASWTTRSGKVGETVPTVEFTMTACDGLGGDEQTQLVGIGRQIDDRNGSSRVANARQGPRTNGGGDGEAPDSDDEIDRPRTLEGNAHWEQLAELLWDRSLDRDETIRRGLQLGRDRLGAGGGHLTAIDEDRQQCEITHGVGRSSDRVDTVSELGETCCSVTVEATDEPVVVDEAAEDAVAGTADDSAPDSPSIGRYIGATVTVDGTLRGTVCFVDERSGGSFTSDERAFVERLSRWLSHLLEYHKYDVGFQRADRQLRAVLENTTNPVYIKDRDRGYQFVNDAATETTGVPASEIIGKSASDLHDGEELAAIREADRRVLEQGETVTKEIEKIVGGERRIFVDTKYPYRTEDGDIIGIIGVGRDVTERKRRERELRETNEWLNGIIEASPDAILALDAAGTVELWNPAAERIFGWSAEEVLGEPLPIIPEEKSEEYDRFRERVYGGETISGAEIERQHKDGTLINVSLSAAPVFDEDGDVTGIMAALEDISERKEYERELQERERELTTLMDNVPGMVYRCANEPDWPFEFASQGCRELTGYEPEALVDGDLDWSEDVLVTDNEELWETVQEALDDEEPFTVSYRIKTAEGERRWCWERGQGVFENGELQALEGVILDITERKEHERELEQADTLFENAQDAFFLMDVEDGGEQFRIERVNPSYESMTGLSEEELGGQTIESAFGAEEAAKIASRYRGCIEDEEPKEYVETLSVPEPGSHWSTRIAPVVADGTVEKIAGATRDITEQKHRELTLESLHEATRGLLGTDSEHEIAELVVETTADVLDLPGVAVYTLDTATSTFSPIAMTDAYVDLVGDGAPVAAGDTDSVIWNAFVSGASQLPADEPDDASTPRFDDETAGLAVPIGDHGVLVVARRGSSVTRSTRQLVETLVATTAAAFGRLESESELRERETELADQNEQLKRQVQINEIIRSIDRSLVRTGTREAIETAVCDRLVEVDWIDFAWIGEPNASQTALDPRTWSGTSPEYLDRIPLDDPTMDGDPAWAAVQTGEPRVVETVLEGIQTEGWRKQALVHGYQSIVSVPLAYEEYTYGVLTVYASEAGAFDDLERSVFAELGANIASSINAVETRRALHTDASLEVTLGFEQPEALLARLARQAECTVCYESLVADEGEQSRLFVTVEQASMDAVRAVLEELHAVQEWSVVSERDGDDEDGDGDGEPDGETLVALTVSCPTLAEKLVRHGGRPRSITATPAGLEVIADLPVETDVREYVEMLTDQFGPTELESRRTVERELCTRQGHVTSLLSSLTDRQLEVLRTAYFGGFFQWPRESTGEEIADLLGVSQPTVNRHLRLGQRALLAQLFDEEA